MEVDIQFDCPCGASVEKYFSISEPSFMAGYHSEGDIDYWESVVCDACYKDFDVHMRNTFFDIDVSVDGAINLNFEERSIPNDEYLNWIIESTDQCDQFTKIMKDVVTLIEVETTPTSRSTLHNMLYAQVVTAFEAYLSSIFIHTVLNSEDLIRKLVESDEIFAKKEKLKIIVAKYLKNLLFHDLKKVKPMFRDVLDIEFTDISWLFKAVLLRHDCVHRSGYDKDGNYTEISKEDITELVNKGISLIGYIEEEIGKMDILLEANFEVD